jgi:NADP-dependent 3-hydroxy acid dehydrogenase YdfG
MPIVVISGAATGLGRKIAERFEEGGYEAHVCDANPTAVEEFRASHPNASSSVVDVSDTRQVDAWFDEIAARHGRIDVLINNAGIMPLSALESLKLDEWDRMIDLNIKGVLYGIAAALPHMKAQKSGHVITTSSVAGHLVFPASSVYSGTKFAVRAICEGFRQEVKEYNIRTTILCPGAVKTELLDHISDDSVRGANEEYVGTVGISASSFASMVAFAINQPEDVDVNEIIFRPTAQQL